MMVETDEKISELRPIMKISELVPHLKKKNVKFEKISEQEAEDYFAEWMSNYSAGGEVLHLSNPGDYPLEMVEQEPDYDVVEI